MSRVIIYTKKSCPWSDRLKTWLKDNQIDFEEIDVEEDKAALDHIKNQGLSTVPQVFIDGVHRPHEPIYSGLLEWIHDDTAAQPASQVIKRDRQQVPFDGDKIKQAIEKANNETKELTPEEVTHVAGTVVEKIDQAIIEVEEIQDLVEMELMSQYFPQTAKAYILYREKQKQLRKRDIFKPRKHLKPYEYPELESYKEAIQHSYWLHTEYNYTSDIQDYKVNVQSHERTAIRHAMLAISQVEVSV